MKVLALFVFVCLGTLSALRAQESPRLNIPPELISGGFQSNDLENILGLLGQYNYELSLASSSDERLSEFKRLNDQDRQRFKNLLLDVFRSQAEIQGPKQIRENDSVINIAISLELEDTLDSLGRIIDESPESYPLSIRRKIDEEINQRIIRDLQKEATIRVDFFVSQINKALKKVKKKEERSTREFLYELLNVLSLKVNRGDDLAPPESLDRLRAAILTIARDSSKVFDIELNPETLRYKAIEALFLVSNEVESVDWLKDLANGFSNDTARLALYQNLILQTKPDYLLSLKDRILSDLNFTGQKEISYEDQTSANKAAAEASRRRLWLVELLCKILEQGPLHLKDIESHPMISDLLETKLLSGISSPSLSERVLAASVLRSYGLWARRSTILEALRGHLLTTPDAAIAYAAIAPVEAYGILSDAQKTSESIPSQSKAIENALNISEALIGLDLFDPTKNDFSNLGSIIQSFPAEADYLLSYVDQIRRISQSNSIPLPTSIENSWTKMASFRLTVGTGSYAEHFKTPVQHSVARNRFNKISRENP